MFDDLTKSVKAQLYERVSSPLLSTFLFSWLAWNYRFVLVLVSSMTATEKISYIDNNIFMTSQEIVYRGIIFPLITSSLLIFIYPIPARYVYHYWRKRQKELKEIQQQIDDETPLTKEEARQLRRETLTVSLEYDKLLQDRASEIVRLKARIEDLQHKNNAMLNESREHEITKTKGSERVLADSQLEMLEKIAKSEDGIFKSSLLRDVDDRVLAEYDLGELLNGEYVSQAYSKEYNQTIISATHIGLTAIVKWARHNNSQERTE